MNRYHYQAIDKQGNLVAGETDAASPGQAIAQLELQGFKVQSISVVDALQVHLESRSSEELKAVEHLRGQAVRNAQAWSAPLQALSQEIKSRWIAKKVSKLSAKLQTVTSVERLASDSDTAEILPLVLKELDSSCESENWLMKLTQQLEFRRTQRRDLLYPIVSSLTLVAILVVGAIWIVPSFREMFEEFGLTLPAPTKLVFAISSSVYPNTIQSVIAIAVLVAAVATLIWFVRKSVWIHQHLPILTTGSSSSLRAMGVLSQNTAELMQLNYPLPTALRIAALGCNHVGYQSFASALADELESKGSSSQTPSNTARAFFPPLLLGAMSSGAADVNTLRRIGGIYRDREQEGSRQFALILSQLMMAGTGVVIGFVVIALFMPLVKMVTALA